MPRDPFVIYVFVTAFFAWLTIWLTLMQILAELRKLNAKDTVNVKPHKATSDKKDSTVNDS